MKKPKLKKKPVKMDVYHLPRKQKKAALKLLNNVNSAGLVSK
jgi:hypothetical protein